MIYGKQIIGTLLAAMLVVPTLAAELDKGKPPAPTQAELRKTINDHMAELKAMFPTLQGVGTLPAGGGVALTIFAENSTPEEEATQAQAAKALLGVPVRLLVVPVTLRRVGAIDIPMNSALANERLDSKTCFSVVKTQGQGQLVGYELNDMLVSSNGRLEVLPATGSFGVGDGKRRTYTNGKIFVAITPISMKRNDIEEDVVFEIIEKAEAVISEGKLRQRLKLHIKLHCSP